MNDKLGNPLTVGDDVAWIGPDIGIRATIMRFTTARVVIRYDSIRSRRRPRRPATTESIVKPTNLVGLFPPVNSDDPYIIWSNFPKYNDPKEQGLFRPATGYTVERCGEVLVDFGDDYHDKGYVRSEAYVVGHSRAVGIEDPTIEFKERVV